MYLGGTAMATIIGPQTITIGSDTDLVFQKSWVPKYSNEIKKGNTSTKKASTATNGEAILRVSHQVTKGIEGHVISLEVEGTRGSLLPQRLLAKGQLVLTCQDTNVEEAELTKDIAVALCTYVPTVIDDIFADLTD